MNIEQIYVPLLLTLLAGLSTGIGSLIALFIKEFKKSYLQFSLGLSAGVMIYVSFVELLDSAIRQIGFLKANLAFFAGILFIMIIDFVVPHEYIEEKLGRGTQDKKLLASGVLTALGIAIHNLPEGLAVFMSSVGGLKLGIPLAFAIAIHNIPEGIAVSMPIYYATHSRKKAFWYSLLSGIAEPIGAIIGIFVLLPFLNQTILSACLAAVGGIMVFISCDELLPTSYEQGAQHLSIVGLIAGMIIMALSLHLLH